MVRAKEALRYWGLNIREGEWCLKLPKVDFLVQLNDSFAVTILFQL